MLYIIYNKKICSLAKNVKKISLKINLKYHNDNDYCIKKVINYKNIIKNNIIQLSI